MRLLLWYIISCSRKDETYRALLSDFKNKCNTKMFPKLNSIMILLLWYIKLSKPLKIFVCGGQDYN